SGGAQPQARSATRRGEQGANLRSASGNASASTEQQAAAMAAPAKSCACPLSRAAATPASNISTRSFKGTGRLSGAAGAGWAVSAASLPVGAVLLRPEGRAGRKASRSAASSPFRKPSDLSRVALPFIVHLLVEKMTARPASRESRRLVNAVA